MSHRRYHPVCVDCGVHVGAWQQRCPPCKLEHNRQMRKNQNAKRSRYHCVDCGKVCTAERCQSCNGKYTYKIRVEAGKAARDADRVIKSRFAWWHSGPPVGGFAIAGPGG